MEIIYSDETIDFDRQRNDNTVFLAGPTPRDNSVESWRKDAIEIFKEIQYPGKILIPEQRDWNIKFDYSDQIEWELTGMSVVKHILFWIPRNMKNMPGLTTNVEFGNWVDVINKSIFYGRPDNADNIKYLDYMWNKRMENIHSYTIKYGIHNNLKEMIKSIPIDDDNTSYPSY